MQQNNTDALKRAIVEGMTAILDAIDNIGDTTPTKGEQKSAPPSKPVKAPKKKKRSCYRVEDLRALYHLADKELLHYIRGTAASTHFPGSYAYLVEKNAETKAALAVFLTQAEIAEHV